LKQRVVLQATNDQARTLARPPTRRGDLDVLRALVVVGLALFHSAVIFGAGEFPVKAETEHRTRSDAQHGLRPSFLQVRGRVVLVFDGSPDRI
jgi:peptidoglycan/LPS O-acetylase OafA/YrhL